MPKLLPYMNAILRHKRYRVPTFTIFTYIIFRNTIGNIEVHILNDKSYLY
jgi:hypothetical protein